MVAFGNVEALPLARARMLNGCLWQCLILNVELGIVRCYACDEELFSFELIVFVFEHELS